MPISLEPPSATMLPQVAAALRTGWSPNNVRDVSGDHLAAIDADPAAFLGAFTWRPASVVTQDGGATQPRLPGPTFWISDGGSPNADFCGWIGLRYMPGTLDLPGYVSGHVGYGVVPWKRGRGIATAALRLLLPVAAGLGLERVSVTTDPENLASQRVVLAAGGVAAGRNSGNGRFPDALLFWVQTAPAQTAK